MPVVTPIDENAPFNFIKSDNGLGVRRSGDNVEFYSGWKHVQEMIDDAPEGGTVTLYGDYKAALDDEPLKLTTNKSITLDLAGHTLDRNRGDDDESDGHVIDVNKGHLTITDSSTNRTGTITGGFATDGGGIVIGGEAKCTITGGNIKGNNAREGGAGIYNYGTLIITGDNAHHVVISENYAGQQYGGGIRCHSSGTVSLAYVDITQNHAKKQGGGLYLDMNADATFDHCYINENSSNEYAGGLSMTSEGDKLTITNSEINNNYAKSGIGGIYLEKGEMDIQASKISNNVSDKDAGGIKVNPGCTCDVSSSSLIQANRANGGEGGGIKNHGTASLRNCSVLDNYSSAQGGGIYNNDAGGVGATFKLYGVDVQNNNANGAGGGIYNNASMTFNDDDHSTATNTITGNKSNYAGGGVYTDASASTNLSYTNKITGNTEGCGNDLYVNNSSDNIPMYSNTATVGSDPIYIDCSDKDKNVVGKNGGFSGTEPFKAPVGIDVSLDGSGEYIKLNAGRWNNLQTTIDNASDSDTINLDKSYTAGSSDTCLYVRGNKHVTINLNGLVIDRNRTSKDDNGMVFNIESGSALTIKDSSENNVGIIKGGFAKKGGAFMVNEGASLNIESGTITGNKADVDGGAVYVQGSLSVTGGVFANNYADDTGGAIYCDEKGIISLKNATFTGNSSDNSGGALNLNPDPDAYIAFEIYDCTFSNNNSDDNGGAIRLASKKTTLDIKRTNFENNFSSDDGGAIYIHNGKVLMEGGKFTGNTTDNDSGAVKVTDKTKFTANSVEFSNNTANKEEAGAVKVFGEAELVNCQIHDNVATQQGGALYVDDDGILKINNCTIYKNNTAQAGGAIYANGSAKVYLSGSSTGVDIEGNNAQIGGGIYCGEDVDFYIQDKIIVKDNTSTSRGKDYYGHGYLDLSGPMQSGSEIYVEIGDDTGRFTKNYSKYNDSDDPNTFFKSSLNYDVYKEDGEVYLGSSWSDLEKQFKNAADGSTITITQNYTAKDGDGPLTVDGKNITVNLNGFILNRHLDDDEDRGHVFRVVNNATLTINDSTNNGIITGGYANNGGAINIDGNSTVNINGGIIKGNNASEDGGAIYVNKGTLNISGGTIELNEATNGAAIFLDGGDKAKLYITGGEINNNTASKKAGGIYVETGSAINISGSPKIHGNNAKSSKDIYLDKNMLINITGVLNGAKIVADTYSGEGIITSGYGANNTEKSPSKYFSSAEGYAVNLTNNEVALGYASQGETDLQKAFVDPGDQIETDIDKLSSSNWMAGISGERYLNEFNMPVSHDSSMNNIESKIFDWTTWVPGAFSHKLAKTQIRYINEQMNEGIRKFDLRLNPVYKKFKVYPFPGYYWEDDGENLFMCHGKTKYGTIQALDPDDDYLKFNTILDWSKEFLREHPTETIILELSDELDYDYQNKYWTDETYARAGRILSDFSREKNPATGESYLYKEAEAESYLEPYTHMPQLKDCRGKIVIMSKNDYLDKTGGMTLDSVGVKSWSGQSYKISPTEKITETQQHYKELEESFGKDVDNPLKLTVDTGEPCANYVWSFALNVTNQENDTEYVMRRIAPGVDCAPYEYAETVNNELFGDGKLFAQSGATNKTGTYLGWVSMDGATEKYAYQVWRTNFPHDGEFPELTSNYVTVTMEVPPDLKALGYEDQVFPVLKGTTITIPDNIFKNLDGRYLSSWRNYIADAPQLHYYPGEKVKVVTDMLFKPVFLKEGMVPVSIEWQDGNNVDGLRAAKIPFEITPDGKAPYSISVSEDQNYRTYVNINDIADISKIKPKWPGVPISPITPYGVDGQATYKYEVRYDKSLGYVFKFIHTSDNRKDIEGNINWIDDDNKDNTRPRYVTVSLYEQNAATPKQVATVIPDTSGVWKYSFKDIPQYSSGNKIDYYIKVDSIDGYTTHIDGYDVTNVLKTLNKAVDGFIIFDDGFNTNLKRPKNVKVQLYANDVKKAEETVNASKVVVPFYFDNTPPSDSRGREINYSVTQSAIEGYNTTVTKSDSGVIIIYNKYNNPDRPICKVNAYSSNKECKASIVEPEVSPSSLTKEFNKDTTVTVKAQSKYGYKFLGWYKANSVEGEQVTSYGELLSEDKEYDFKVAADTNVVAIYEPNIVELMKPTGISGLTANKTSQELLRIPLLPLPDGYTMKYALSASEDKVPSDAKFSEEIPKGYDAGTYYVWYKPVGDAYHDSLPATCIKVVIAPGVEPGGNYEDVPVTPGEVTDITGTDDAPEESDPNNAHIDNPEDLPFDDDDIAMGVNVWVKVTPLDVSKVPESERIKIAQASQGYNVASYFDIKVYAKIGLLEPIQIKDSILPILVSFNSNNLLRGNKTDFGIVRMHDGVASFLNIIYNNDTDRLIFASTKFSTYALVYKDVNDNTIDPDNQSNTATTTTTTTTTYTLKTKAAKTKDEFNIGYVFMSIIDKLF